MSFLQFTLDGDLDALQTYCGDKAQVHAEGILEFEAQSGQQQALVISCGLHGNETAPIELVDKLVDEIVTGKLSVQNPLLVILGNPAAARQQCRFVEENLNRLFSNKCDSSSSTSLEADRAATIKTQVADFYARHTLDNDSPPEFYHYDLHTAIRPSKITRFAVYPYLHDRDWDKAQLRFLELCGIEAVLLSNQPAGTFSYYSSTQFNAHSFTLELGRVKPFGENDLSKFSAIKTALARLIEGRERFADTCLQIQIFEVVEEVIKRSDALILHIPKQAENFTDYPAGTLLASDGDYSYITQRDGERFVFPIQDVPIGQRAMLVVAPTSLP